MVPPSAGTSLTNKDPGFHQTSVNGVSLSNSSSPRLWSGLQQAGCSDHTDRGILQGFFPHRPRRGRCIIWTTDSSLWVYTAQALGFDVALLRSTDHVFLKAMTALFPYISSTNDGTQMSLTHSFMEDEDCDIWFTDFDTVSSAPWAHWIRRQVPHLFSVPRTGSVRVPQGWCYKTHRWRHSDLGGSTVGEFQLGLLVPQAGYVPTTDPPPMPRQPWAPVASVISDVEYAKPLPHHVLTQYVSHAAFEGEAPVRWLGKVLDSRGLGMPPLRMPRIPVVVGCVFNPSKLGSRFLTTTELGALHDIPILFLDHLRSLEGSMGVPIISRLIQDAPGKILFLGSDYLLTHYVRGGGSITSRLDRGTGLESAPKELGISVSPKLAQIQVARLLAIEECGGSSSDPFIVQEIGKMNQEMMTYKKDDDSPIHFRIWDEMFLVSRAAMLGEGDSLQTRWKDPSTMVSTPSCDDPRDCMLSDTQTLTGYNLPRWRWALTKIRAGVLRYWRKQMTQKCVAHIGRGANARASASPASWVCRVCRSTGKRKREEDDACPKEYRYEWRSGRRKGKGRAGTAGGKQCYKTAWEASRVKYGKAELALAGRDCMTRTANSLWWGWTEGSSLMWFTWPRSHWKWAREGQPHFLVGELPRFRKPQRPARTPEMMEKMKVKVNKVRRRRYIDTGEVTSLTHMFAVPKGSRDLRMVYNGTSSGLNDVLFAPHFGLPTLSNTSRALLGGYYQTDLDVAEMFLCFPLHPEMRPYAGVDVSLIRTPPGSLEEEPWEEGRTRIWERWVRNFMGMRDSPYRCMQLMLRAKYCAYGDRTEASNPFKWDRVVLNLPGDESYDRLILASLGS